MEISTLATTITGLKKEVDELKNSLKGVNTESEKYKSVSDQIAAKDKEILQLKQQLKQQLQENFSATKNNADANNEFTKSVEDTNNAFKDMRKALMENKGELLELQKAYEAGQIGLDEFKEKIKGAGGLKDEMDDLNNYIRKFSSDTLALDQTLEGLQFGVATFGAVSGAMSALGLNTASTEKILKTFAVTQQLLNSLQVIQTQLMDKTTLAHKAYHSVLKLLGIEQKANTVATKADAAASTADAAAKTAQAAATGTATIATKAFGVALKGIGIGLIISLIAGLVEGLVWLNEKFNIVGKTIDALKSGFQAVTDWLGFTSEAERKAEAQAAATAEKNKKLKESYDEVMKGAQSAMHGNDELIAKLIKYDKTIKDTTKSDNERLDAMRKVNQETGKEVFNLKDKQKALNNCGGAIQAYIKNMYTEMQVQTLLAKAAHDYVNILMLEANVKKAAAAGKDAPETKKQIENHKQNIEMYQKEAAELAKGIKTYKDYTTSTSHATTATQEHTKSISEQDKQLQNIKKHRQELIDILKARVEADLDADFNLDITIKNKQELKDSIKKQFEDLFSDYNVMDEIFKNAEKTSKGIKERGELSKQLGGFSDEEISTAKESDKYKNAQAAMDAHLDYLRSKRDEAKQLYEQLTSVPNQDPALAAAALEQYQKTLDQYSDAAAGSTTQMNKTLLEILGKGSEDIGEEKKKWFSKKDLTTDDIVNATQEMMAGVGDVLSTVADMKEKSIEQDVKNGKISEEQAKKEFKKVKALKISTAIIDMLNGVVSAVSGAQSLGPILGPIMAAINSAAVITAGTQNIKQIKSTEFGDEGGTGGAAVVQAASPILDENRDITALSGITTAINTAATANAGGDTKVYVTEQDITDTQNKVKVREQNNKW